MVIQRLENPGMTLLCAVLHSSTCAPAVSWDTPFRIPSQEIVKSLSEL